MLQGSVAITVPECPIRGPLPHAEHSGPSSLPTDCAEVHNFSLKMSRPTRKGSCDLNEEPRQQGRTCGGVSTTAQGVAVVLESLPKRAGNKKAIFR